MYRLSVAAGLQAIDGTRLQSSFAWTFTTVLPAVQNVYPSDGYQYAMPRPTIALTFNQHMDHVTTQAAFHLLDTRGESVPGTFAWTGLAMQFRPAARIAAQRLLHRPPRRRRPLRRRAATHARSCHLELHRGAVSPCGRYRPFRQCRGRQPEPGRLYHFSAPVDQNSAIAALSVVPDLPDRYVSTSQDGLSMQISGLFAPSTAYTFTIRAGLRAQAGDTLGRPFTLHFVSAPLPPDLSFVSGSVAVYQATRPITLSLQASTRQRRRRACTRWLRRPSSTISRSQKISTQIAPPSSQQVARSVRPDSPLNQTVPIQAVVNQPGHQPLPPGYYLADRHLPLLRARRSAPARHAHRPYHQALARPGPGLGDRPGDRRPVANLPLQVVATNVDQPSPLQRGLPLLWHTYAVSAANHQRAGPGHAPSRPQRAGPCPVRRARGHRR